MYEVSPLAWRCKEETTLYPSEIFLDCERHFKQLLTTFKYILKTLDIIDVDPTCTTLKETKKGQKKMTEAYSVQHCWVLPSEELKPGGERGRARPRRRLLCRSILVIYKSTVGEDVIIDSADGVLLHKAMARGLGSRLQQPMFTTCGKIKVKVGWSPHFISRF